MSDVRVDFAALSKLAEENQFKPLPVGVYTFQITDVQAGLTKDQTKTQFVVKMKVVGGEHDGKTLRPQYFTISPENGTALNIFFQNLEAFGLTREWLASTNPAPQQIAETLVGRQAKAKLKLGKWNGRDTNDVDGVFQSASSIPGSGVLTPSTPQPPGALPPSGKTPALMGGSSNIPNVPVPSAPASAPAPAPEQDSQPQTPSQPNVPF